MYTGKAFLFEFEGDARPHLFVVLSEPEGERGAILACLDTYHADVGDYATVGAGEVLTEPKGVQYRTSRESQIDVAFTRMISAEKLDRILARESGLCGNALPWFLKLCRKAVCEDLWDCESVSTSRALEQLEVIWRANGDIG